jgi:Glycosyl hydrolases family 39/Glycosyl hydrolases family 2, sugar binding domain
MNKLILLLILTASPLIGAELKNPDFKNGEQAWLKWRKGKSAERKISKFGRKNTPCAFIAIPDKGKAAWMQVINKVPQGKYIFSAWTRSSTMTGHIELQVTGKKAGKVVCFKRVSSKGQKEWKKLSLKFNNDTDADKWVLALYLQGPGKVWFDDVQISQDKSQSATVNLEGQWRFSPGDSPQWAVPDFDDAKWKTIKVPALWETQGYPDLEGFAWYRKTIDIPSSFSNKTLLLTLGAVSKVDEVFFNGKKIGATGKFPPNLKAETFELRQYLINPELIRKGGVNILAVRVNDGGILMSGGIWKKPCNIRPAMPGEYVKLKLKSNRTGNIFTSSESPVMQLEITNAEHLDIKNATVNVKITDYAKKLILEAKFTPEIKANSRWRQKIKLNPLKCGLYYAAITINSEGKTLISESLNFGILSNEKLTEKINDSTFGVAGHLNRLTERDLNVTLDLAARVGLKWFRTGFLWRDLERTQGDFSWTKFDSTFAVAERLKIKILPTLAIIPEWASSDPLGRQSVRIKSGRMPIIKHWERYVRQMVSRYSKYCQYWEIWNEPNLKSYWKPVPESYEYFQLLNAAYKQIKEVNPQAQVLTAGLVPHIFIKDKNLAGEAFLDELYKYSRGKPVFDHIGYHPYPLMRKNISNQRLTNSLEEMFARMRKVQKQNGDQNSKLWLTETGCPDLLRTIDERRQAECLVLIMTVCKANKDVGKIFWYNFREDGDNPDYNEHNFGLVKHDFSPKPAFFSYRNLIKTLHGKTFVKYEKRPDGVTVYRFKGKGNVWVIWSDTEKTFTLPFEKCKVSDLMGRIKTAKNGKIKVGQSPIYIEFNK